MVFASPPRISISLAPPNDPLVEPYSPFKSDTIHDEDDGFRTKHLTPPPTHMSFAGKQLSPLRPVDTVNRGQGLERERFEALLKASRERNAAVGARKTNDLRKEIALKAHKTKQVERRALFLSKVAQPPSPSAATLPKTPPESPAIFHYTLPSPGLVSPLALFESLNGNPTMELSEPWVEQVDFRLPAQKPIVSSKPIMSRKSQALPSLEEISARLRNYGHAPRLPPLMGQAHPANERRRLAVGVGRLQIPVRSPQPTKAEHLTILPPKSPCSPLSPQLQITTTVVPRSSSLSPTELSEINLLALDSRQRRAQDMLSTIRRRTIPSDLGLNGRDGDAFSEANDDRKFRRQSAPADLFPRPRTGFEHPILKLPGAF